MSHDMFNVHLPADLRRAAMNFAADNAIGLGDVVRMTLARYLSKEGYYRTGGRGGARKGAGRKRHVKAPEDAPEIKARMRIDFQ